MSLYKKIIKMIKIIQEKCDGCGNCVEVCPFGVLIIKNLENCKRCGACMHACPNNAIEINEGGEN